nr:Xaa-Pro peptidase family protein [Candidatus Njordarchaeum guaymaensis]
MTMRIDTEEYSERIRNLRSLIEEEGLDVYLAGTVENAYYLSGLAYRPYERIFFVVVPRDDEPFLFVPKLEEEHAKKISWIKNVSSYSEYPAGRGREWFTVLRSHLIEYKKKGIESTLPIGIKQSLNGSHLELRVVDLVEHLRIVKSTKEVEKIRFAAKVADKVAQRMLKNSKEGAPLMTIIAPTSQEMYSTVLGKIPDANLLVTNTTAAVWMGPISTMPHRAPSAFDVVKSGVPNVELTTVQADGYSAECERTFFAKHADQKAARIFGDMMEAREKALNEVREGALCSTIDLAAKDFLVEKGYEKNILHRTGHGLGIGTHEEPWVAEGYDYPLKENMIISIEPGIYFEGYGGFRHSDTVLATRSGYEILTKTPIDLDSLTIK